MMTDHTIGLIGIGLLGTAMAERLQNSGMKVFGYDIVAARCQELDSFGGRVAQSASQVAEECSFVLLSLPHSGVVRDVIAELPVKKMRNHIIIDTTTGDPATSAQLAESLKSSNIGYLDATVAGSSEQARRGDIVIMVGGEAEIFEKSRWLLDLLAVNVFQIGPAGSGARMKLVVNLVLGLNRAVLAEGISLAERCGLDTQMALEILKAGAAYSAVMDNKGEKMVNRDFSTQARLAQHLKDVDLILQLAAQSDLSAPLSEAHRLLLLKAVEQGYGNADNSAVIRAYHDT
ncbi:MAG: NAD(P)-dependent oxidoreductase [Planctomycetota bacterium]|nr:NAD(P)-dependent oxidoreductase [Planctomycetota bacterium]